MKQFNRTAIAAALTLSLSVGTFALGSVPEAAAAPTVPWSSGFETTDAVPYANTGFATSVNVAGKAFGPGSLLGLVSAWTASNNFSTAENGEKATDANSSTKWLSNNTPAILTYTLSSPAVVAEYSITSANDAVDRDPYSWTVEGANAASCASASWTVLDTQTAQLWNSVRYSKKTWTIPSANRGSYNCYRLNITARQGGGTGMMQLADFEILDGTTNPAPPTPMLTAIGTGPASSPTAKANFGWEGLYAYRYSGSVIDDGPANASSLIYDGLSIQVENATELSYKIFPVLGSDLDYRATYAAINLEYTGGPCSGTCYLADSGIKDYYGFEASAKGQGEAKALYANQWNSIKVDISALAGATITKVLLDYNFPNGTPGSFDGWVDSIKIQDADPINGADLLNYVDTRRGSNATGSFSRGNNLVATAYPNGFNFLVPETASNSLTWLYAYHQSNDSSNYPVLQSLAFSHEPSPWMADREQLNIFAGLVANGTTAGNGSRSTRGLAFTHDNETAKPDYYGVTFNNGMEAEMAPTVHGGVFQFTATAASNGLSVIVDRSSDSLTSLVNVSAAGVFTGWVDGGSGLSIGNSRMFFYGVTDRTPGAVGACSGRTTECRYASFDTSSNKVVNLHIATSFISLAQAQANYELELQGQTFQQVRDAAADAWRERLSVVDLSQSATATEAQKVTLYSSLYRLNLYPNILHENTGTASDPVWKYASPVSAKSGSATDTTTNAVVKAGKMYVNNGFWDTYRTVWPAYAFLYPQIAAELVDGFVQQYRDGGWVARWSSPGYADLMTGTSSDASFAEAYTAGALPTDLALDAYDAGLKNATVLPVTPYSGLSAANVGRKGLDTSQYLGYTSTATGQSVSWGLEGLINDYALGMMAQKLAADPATPSDRVQGLQDDAAYLLERAGDYVNFYDPQTTFFRGRDASGSFGSSSFDPAEWGGAFTEASGWTFQFHVPYDVEGLAGVYGSQQDLIDKLDEFFSTPETGAHTIHEAYEARDVRMGMLGFSNQVAHHIPYIYAAAGKPSGTQAAVREILTRLFVGSDIGQGYPGDEDNGEMSSWYIFSALGFYPLALGSGTYQIGSPLFDKVIVNRSASDVLTIEADNQAQENAYIQSATLDGAALDTTYLQQADILTGSHLLKFTMGSSPSTWGERSFTAQAPEPMANVALPSEGILSSSDGTAVTALRDQNSRTEATFSANDVTLEWVSTSGPAVVAQYTLTSGASGSYPTAWTLEGSNDGEAWQVLDTRSGQVFQWASQLRPFQVASPVSYERYRIHITAVSGAAPATLAEVELHDAGAVTADFTFYPGSGLTGWVGQANAIKAGTVKGGSKVSTDYTATVDFLDGNGPVLATVSTGSRGAMNINVTHTFALPGHHTAVVSVVFDDNGTLKYASGKIAVDVSLDATLRSAFNNSCLGQVGYPVDCDSNGWGLSREGYAAMGFVPGTGLVLPNGLEAVIPASNPGENDNALANGQTFLLNLGEGATQLSLLGLANEQTITGTAVINYSDGSTQNYPIGFGDWTGAASAPISGNSVAIKVTTGRLKTSGTTDALTTAIYYTTPITLLAGKTPVSMTLPYVANALSQGQMHIFAVASDGQIPAEDTLTITATPISDPPAAGKVWVGELATTTGPEAQATVNWGDDTPLETAGISDGHISGSHTYAAPGEYTIYVTVYDGFTSVTTKQKVVVGVPVNYTPTLAVAPEKAKPGQSVVATGKGFAPGETVLLTLATNPALQRSAVADAQGNLSVGFEIPAGLGDGSYPLTATGASSGASASVAVAVQAKGAPSQTIATLGVTNITTNEQGVVYVTVPSDATGHVEVFVDDHLLANVTIVNGQATATLPRLPAGKHTVIAEYVGDGKYERSASQPLTLTVGAVKAATPVKVTAKITITAKAFKKNTKPKVVVKVTYSNKKAPTGKVGIYVHGKRVKLVTLKASAKGKLTVTLPKKYSKAISVRARIIPKDTKIAYKTTKALKVKVKK